MINKIVSYGFLFVGLTLALLAVPSEWETLSFAFHADKLVEADAHVTANYTRKHRKGPDTQTVEYTYVVDGEKVKGDNRLTRLSDRPYDVDRLVHTVNDEEMIKVFYLPEEPTVSSIHRDVGFGLPAAIIAFTAFCLVMGAAGVFSKEPTSPFEAKRSEAA